MNSKRFKELKSKFETKKNIVRVQKNKDNPYVMINKQGLNDTQLSWSAKGLLSYLLSLPDDWEIFVNELLKNGYMKKTQYRCEGKVLGLNYTVFEVSTNENNTKATIVNVSLDDNGEIVEVSTLQPNTETTETVMQDTDSTELLNNKSTYNNFTKKEFVVDVVEETVINLYKSFKLEKRVMPHTTRLLKQYANKIDIDVFESIFISASSDSVPHKFKYIKTILERLDEKGIKTLAEYENDTKTFKESKNKNNSRGSSTSKYKKENELNPKIHNFNGSANFKKYTNEEIEAMAKEKLESFNKYATMDPRKEMYDKYTTYGPDELSNVTVENAKLYAIENDLPF